MADGQTKARPTPTGLVVKNGVNSRSSTSGGMPGPLSEISTITAPPRSVVVVIRISFLSALPSTMAWAALTIRFRNTCPSLDSLASTGGV